MKNWIRKWLGIDAIENSVAYQHQAIGRIEDKIRLKGKPLRYDQVNRRRKRRKKQRYA